MGRPDDRQADLTTNPGLITATVLSGVIAVAVAAAEWVGSGRSLDSPAGILWGLVALLGVAATVLGVGLELRRRRRAEQARPAAGPAGRSDAPELPIGTVTFLFTDIEGSTRLLQDLGDRYAAVRAAVVGQRGLAGHRWPTGFPVRVRMGLHTGEGPWAGQLQRHRREPDGPGRRGGLRRPGDRLRRHPCPGGAGGPGRGVPA